MMLVRPRAWWFNKVPFSVMLVLLLVDGHTTAREGLAVVALVVLTVCAVANYGYALNEVYDVAEDRRAGRPNAAADFGTRRLKLISGASAAVGLTSAYALAGAPAAALTALELALPLAYSVPPLRLKERGWLGVGADALAVHVYPAVLALLAARYWPIRPVTAPLVLAVVVWAAATGVRGILTHQLATAEKDKAAGLTTLAHTIGAKSIGRLMLGVVLPVELAALAAVLLIAGVGPAAWVLTGIYIVLELVVRTDRPPFVRDNFYKVWGPLALALDAGCAEPGYLAVIPLYVILFAPDVRAELGRLARALQRTSRATGWHARSSGGG